MGVDQVFVQNQACFERAGMYGDPGSWDYFDNLYRFAVLCWAALEAPLVLPASAPFGEKVVFIANDWQTGLVPLLLTSHYRRWRCYGPARCLFVIHNMGYHGNFPNPLMYNYDLEDPRETPKWHLTDLGLKDDAYYDQFKVQPSPPRLAPLDDDRWLQEPLLLLLLCSTDSQCVTALGYGGSERASERGSGADRTHGG